MRKISKTILFMTLLAALMLPAVALAQPPRGPENRPDVSEIRRQNEIRASESRARAEERKAEIFRQVETKREQVRQDVCQRREQVVADAIPRLSQGAKSVQSSIDKVYQKVTDFYYTGQFVADNYSELIANIESAKTNSEAAIDVIDSQAFVFDCENPGVGKQLSGYRMAVADARSALFEYRAALVELISSMRSAAAQGQNVEEGGDE